MLVPSTPDVDSRALYRAIETLARSGAITDLQDCLTALDVALHRARRTCYDGCAGRVWRFEPDRPRQEMDGWDS